MFSRLVRQYNREQGFDCWQITETGRYKPLNLKVAQILLNPDLSIQFRHKYAGDILKQLETERYDPSDFCTADVAATTICTEFLGNKAHYLVGPKAYFCLFSNNKHFNNKSAHNSTMMKVIAAGYTSFMDTEFNPQKHLDMSDLDQFNLLNMMSKDMDYEAVLTVLGEYFVEKPHARSHALFIRRRLEALKLEGKHPYEIIYDFLEHIKV